MLRNFAYYTQAYLSYKLKKIKLNYPPIQVSIEPTNLCNFKCNFCNQSSPDHFNKRQAGKMDMVDYEIIIRRIKTECRNVKVISLTLDGEPTLHKDLPNMIERANNEGFFVRFSSNGSRIDRRFLEKTNNLSYLISIDFSLDKEGFEKHRGYKESWSTVYNNLRNILEYLSINSNLHLEIFENSAYYDGLDKARKNLKSMQEHFNKNKTPRLNYGLRTYHNILDGFSYGLSRGNYYGCFYPWVSLNIAWNGDVVTCCRDLDGEYILGNVIKSSIEEVWNGQKYLHLRQAVLKQNLGLIPSCRSCDLPYDTQRNKWSYVAQKVFRKW